jgi:hypothetical protein
VQLFQTAIGPERGEAEIHVSGRDDSSSLLPITALQERVFPGTAEVDRQVVPVAPLDEFLLPSAIARPALIKVDVQGYELQALQGCESLLRHFDVVYCECSFLELYRGQGLAEEVIAWLQPRGFHLVGVYNVIHDGYGRAVQADLLCERRGARPLAPGAETK